MKLFLFPLAFLIFGITTAQEAINYKAIIKDSNGNVLNNETIAVRFGIINDSETTTVYQEQFLSVETDDNGLIILEIGEGSPTIGFFENIDWNNGDLYALKVEINLNDGSGYVDMGTSSFNAVPFAQVASTIANIPTRTLEVAGVGEQKLRLNSEDGDLTSLEFLSTGSSTDWKIESSNSWLDFLISESDFQNTNIKFSFHKDGRLGINNSNPIEELHVNGTIRSSDLAGSGTRNIVANANGNLMVETTSPTIRYISVNPAAFRPKLFAGQDTSTSYITGDYVAGLSGNKDFQANVSIPHTATIQNVWFYYVDGSAGSDLSFKFQRKALGGNTTSSIINGVSNGSSSANRFLMTTPVNNTIIDNFNYSYILTVSSTNWANLMYLTGIVISYTD